MCPVLDGIADGAVSKTDGDFAGSEASYSCSYGYGMVGGSTLTCMNSGEWNRPPPECYSELRIHAINVVYTIYRVDHVPSS